MQKVLRPWLCLALVGTFVLSCEEGTPVAPGGAVLRISASPTIIDLGESSTITVVATRTTGSPVNPGTEIRFSTTLGSIDEVAATGDNGVAYAQLLATEDFGQATVSAWSGAIEPVTTEVTMGRPADSVELSASPTVLPDTGGTVQLLALVRDQNGFPQEGAVANFTTTLGQLQSGGRFVSSNSGGEIRDVLSVSAEDISALPGVTFDVSVTVSSGGGGTLSDNFTIRIFSGEPVAAFVVIKTVDDPSTGNCKATFTNESTGENLTYSWFFQNGVPETSTAANPGEVSFTSCTNGSTYTVSLTVTNDAGTDNRQQQITFDGSGT